MVSVKYRLGVPVFSEAGQCPACNHHSDVLGDHAISCGNQGERIARHDSLRDAIHVVTQTACLGATREDRSLLPDTEARPADVLIPHWTGGRDTALDMTVINPLQTLLVRQAATKAGAALEVAYNKKMTQAGEACRREGKEARAKMKSLIIPQSSLIILVSNYCDKDELHKLKHCSK